MFQIQPVTLTRSTLDGSALPAPLPAHVQPQYYAAVIAAEAIGNTGNAKAVELTINSPIVAGYAFFEHGRLVRAVLINSKAFLQGDTNRTSIHLDLGFTGQDVAPPTEVCVKRLAIGWVFAS